MTRFTLLEILTTLQSNNKDEFVEYVRDVFLTQTVKKTTRKREGHTSNLFGLVLVNEESMASGTEHLSPGKSDNERLVFSLLYVCEKKQKEQEQEFKYDLSKAKGNFALIVISLCGRTYQTKTAMWGDMFYSATITLVPPVTLVLHLSLIHI